MNAPVADFVFRRIAAPKSGGYFEANKQFIAPLPIPDASEPDRAEVAARAERLQDLYTQHRDLLAEIGRRMTVVPVRMQPDAWLFPDLPAMAELDEVAPQHLERVDRRAWAKHRRDEELNSRLEALGQALRPDVFLDATFEDGELRFLVDGVSVIDRMFLQQQEGEFVLAQWKLIASSFSIVEGTTGKKLADALRKVALTAPNALREQIVERQRELSEVEGAIRATEFEMNTSIYEIYGLSPDEIRLVEAG